MIHCRSFKIISEIPCKLLFGIKIEVENTHRIDEIGRDRERFIEIRNDLIDKITDEPRLSKAFNTSPSSLF